VCCQGLRANAVTYATLVDADVRAGELARARRTLAAAVGEGVRIDAWSWTALIKGLADAGDMRVGCHSSIAMLCSVGRNEQVRLTRERTILRQEVLDACDVAAPRLQSWMPAEGRVR